MKVYAEAQGERLEEARKGLKEKGYYIFYSIRVNPSLALACTRQCGTGEALLEGDVDGVPYPDHPNYSFVVTKFKVTRILSFNQAAEILGDTVITQSVTLKREENLTKKLNTCYTREEKILRIMYMARKIFKAPADTSSLCFSKQHAAAIELISRLVESTDYCMRSNMCDAVVHAMREAGLSEYEISDFQNGYLSTPLGPIEDA